MSSKDIVVNTKAEFIENVRQWAYLDSQIKLVNEKMKKIREKKALLSENICSYAAENEAIENKIKITDGELRIYEKKEYSPLTFGYIEKQLIKIIQDETKVEFIINYLKDNREITTSKDIRRIITTDSKKYN